MSQIYKVAHLKNNEIVTLYVFYGSKIDDENDSRKIQRAFRGC